MLDNKHGNMIEGSIQYTSKVWLIISISLIEIKNMSFIIVKHNRNNVGNVCIISKQVILNFFPEG